MDIAARLDKEHLAALDLLPTDVLDLTDIRRARERVAELDAAMPTTELPATARIDDHVVDGPDGSELVVRLYTAFSTGRCNAARMTA